MQDRIERFAPGFASGSSPPTRRSVPDRFDPTGTGHGADMTIPDGPIVPGPSDPNPSPTQPVPPTPEPPTPSEPGPFNPDDPGGVPV